MSFARIVNRLKDRSQGKGIAVSVVEALHKGVLEGNPRYSKRAARNKVTRLLEAVENHDVDAMGDLLADIYFLLIDIRPRAEHVFHPSTLEDDCPRKLWYDLNKTPISDHVGRGFSAQLLMVFNLGTWFHMYVQKILRREGMMKQAEVPVKSDKYKVDGRMDGLIDIGHDAGLEIKTMNSFQYKKALAQNKPFDKHKKQAGLYGHLLGLKTIVFLYFNKDTSECHEFHWEIELKVIQPMLDKMGDILKAKKPPTRECPNSSCDMAKTCSYKTHCFKK